MLETRPVDRVLSMRPFWSLNPPGDGQMRRPSDAGCVRVLRNSELVSRHENGFQEKPRPKCREILFRSF